MTDKSDDTDQGNAPGGATLGNPVLSVDWQPLAKDQAAVAAAMNLVRPIVAAQQAQAHTFFTESGGDLSGTHGHTPVAMGAENIAGGADLGGPSNPGTTDNATGGPNA